MEPLTKSTLLESPTYENWERLFQQQDEQLKQVLQELADIKYALDQSSIVATTDQRGRIIYVNEKFCQISGYSKEELLGQDHRILNSGYHSREFFKQMWQTIGTGQIWRGEVRNKAKDGSFYWVDTTIIPFCDETGKPYQYVSIRNDISQRKQIEQELKVSKEKYRLITENTEDLISIVTPTGDFLYVSPSHQSALGKELDELESSNLFQYIVEEDQKLLTKRLQLVAASKQATLTEFRLIGAEGHIIHVEARMNPIVSQATEGQDLVLILRDITERKQSEKTIYHLAYHDALTELPNRRLFLERLHKEITSAQKKKSMLAVMFLDMDRFKDINDTWGHDVGDLLLIETAKRLKSCIRSGDIVARLGGDEFTILLTNLSDRQEVKAIAERILSSFQVPFKWGEHLFHLSFSMGISIFPEDAENTDDLLKRADTALYAVKSRGRNEFLFFHPTLEVKTLERILLENELRKAIEQKHFALYYQPKLDLVSGKATGMEVLVRWNHPELGLISPSKFIPLAEESGMIIPLGEWILREACRQNKRWQEEGYPPLRVAVNISAKQFLQDNLLEMIQSILNETGLDPQWLELELTESVVLDIGEAAPLLASIRELGIHISIDDFGTGYSTFTYLKDLPVDTIKIDSSFIRDVHLDQESQAIVKAILAVAQGLSLQVVAEGVETDEQLQILHKDGCHQGQGYLFSKPLPQEEFETYLRSLAKQ